MTAVGAFLERAVAHVQRRFPDADEWEIVLSVSASNAKGPGAYVVNISVLDIKAKREIVAVDADGPDPEIATERALAKLPRPVLQ